MLFSTYYKSYTMLLRIYEMLKRTLSLIGFKESQLPIVFEMCYEKNIYVYSTLNRRKQPHSRFRKIPHEYI